MIHFESILRLVLDITLDQIIMRIYFQLYLKPLGKKYDATRQHKRLGTIVLICFRSDAFLLDFIKSMFMYNFMNICILLCCVASQQYTIFH